MAYQAIYRKWRPQVFEDIVGQTHITNTLKNQIMNDRVSHAYLFCGTRGTGKTTAAKVLAKAVNCLNPINGSPCNQCEICKGISDGSIMDVTEIDAASNNGVENIRDLRDDVGYVSTRTKYRVYIIDEVHMLSIGAFNALLKTLEEPPAHVIFILATTEAHKIPETILSRCQRFDFKRISPSDIVVRMKEIATADGINITDDAYHTLAQMADGSMRDGLSILERCTSACQNQIDNETILNVLGIFQGELLFDIADAIISSDAEKAIDIIASAVNEGKDLNVTFDALTKHFRDLLIFKIMNNPKGAVDYSENMIVKLRAQSEKASYEKLSHIATVLTKAKKDAKWLKNPRVIYELAVIKLTRPELDSSKEALLDRLKAIEEIAKNPVTIIKEEKKEEKKSEPVKKELKISSKLFVPVDKNSLTQDSPLVTLAKGWNKLASSICAKLPYLSGVLLNRNVSVDGEGLLLLFNKNEAAQKKIAVKYLEQLQKEFSNISKTDFIIKPVYINEVEDVMIDIWALPKDSSKKTNEAVTGTSTDPLERLGTDFSQIVEYSNDYNPQDLGDDDFSYQEMSDNDYDIEEYLTEEEKNTVDPDEE